MKVVSVNPSEVVGPYDTSSFGRLFFLLRDGKLPARSPGTIQVTHVHDVVRAHLDAVTKGRSGQRYLLTGDEIEFPELRRGDRAGFRRQDRGRPRLGSSSFSGACR